MGLELVCFPFWPSDLLQGPLFAQTQLETSQQGSPRWTRQQCPAPKALKRTERADISTGLGGCQQTKAAYSLECFVFLIYNRELNKLLPDKIKSKDSMKYTQMHNAVHIT